MNNLLASDMRRMVRSKSFLWLCIVAPAVLILSDVIMYLAARLLDIEVLIESSDLVGMFESRYAALVTALFVSCFLGHETVTGCLRNKIVCGNSRLSCFLSSCCCALPASILVHVSAYVMSFLCGVIFGKGFTFDDTFFKYLGLRVASTLVLSVLFVTITYLFAGNNGAYVAGGALTSGMIIWGLDILSKLYPDDGIVKISGTKLMIYQFVDKYVPFSYPGTPVLRSLEVYATGLAGTLIVALLAGGLIFTRKDLK